jgi:RNA polymerase sigma factor (TIGR02999 family)
MVRLTHWEVELQRVDRDFGPCDVRVSAISIARSTWGRINEGQEVEEHASDGTKERTGSTIPMNRDRVDGESQLSPDDGGLPAQVDSEQLLTELYADLRKMAAGKMAREQAVQTLQPTALVHEAWLKLGDQKFENQAHFFGAAAEAMRRILVERARRRGRQKRGSGVAHADYEESQIESPMEDDQLLEVHEVLDRYAAEDPVKAEVVKLRFFAGLTHSEIAALLVVSEKTARRHWQVAKIRLFQIINEG